MVNYKGKLYICGGHRVDKSVLHRIKDIYDELWTFDLRTFWVCNQTERSLETKVWKQVSTDANPCAMLTEHNAVVYGDSMWILAGLRRLPRQGSEYSNSLMRWNLDTNSGIEVISRSPFTGRSTASTVVWKDSLFIFGGNYSYFSLLTFSIGCNGRTNEYFNDIYEYKFRTLLLCVLLIWLETGEWVSFTKDGPAPVPRCYHLAVVYENFMYIFGGYTGEEYLN
jgi:hypothetical protein